MLCIFYGLDIGFEKFMLCDLCLIFCVKLMDVLLIFLIFGGCRILCNVVLGKF